MALKQLTGYCGFCLQGRLVSVPDSKEFTQEELNVIASDECECPGAREHREREDKIDRAKLFLDNLIPEKDEGIKPLMVSAVPLIIDHKLKKCSINIDGQLVYTIRRGQDGSIVAERRQTIVDETEIE